MTCCRTRLILFGKKKNTKKPQNRITAILANNFLKLISSQCSRFLSTESRHSYGPQLCPLPGVDIEARLYISQ